MTVSHPNDNINFVPFPFTHLFKTQNLGRVNFLCLRNNFTVTQYDFVIKIINLLIKSTLLVSLDNQIYIIG